MIIKKYSDIKIDFYGLKYLEEIKPDESGHTKMVLWNEVNSFRFTRELIPDIFHVNYMPSQNPEFQDIYEINLHYYKIHGHSKLVVEKYFEYMVNYSENSKTIQETYPEIMV